MHNTPSNATALVRVVLMKCETYRVRADQQGLRVRAGQAWVTLNGRDLVLKRGDEIAVESGTDFAVVSAVGRAPAVIELLSETPCQPAGEPCPAVTAL